MCNIEINGRTLKQSTIIEIGKFAILWNIFENDKCQNDCNVTILRSLNLDNIEEQYWINLSQIFKNRVDVNECNTNNYVDCKLSLGRGLPQEAKKEVQLFIKNNGRSNKVGGLIAIYRIRNNMYHGLKNWAILDEQIDLFIGINAFLEKFLLENN